MKPANAQLIKNAALGSIATTAGVASIAAGVDSASLVAGEGPMVYSSSISPQSAECVREDFLISHGPEGMPAQATAVPSAFSSFGFYNIQKGAEYWNKEIPD